MQLTYLAIGKKALDDGFELSSVDKIVVRQTRRTGTGLAGAGRSVPRRQPENQRRGERPENRTRGIEGSATRTGRETVTAALDARA